MNRVTLFAIAGTLLVALAATPAGATPQHRACVLSCKHNAKQCKAGCVQLQKACVRNCP